MIFIILLILSSTCYSNVLDCFVKGHDPLNETRISSRDETLRSYRDYIEETKKIPLNEGVSRVLLCTTYEEKFDYKNCVVSYNVSPVSMMYFNQPSENSYTDIIDALQNSRAGYLYITQCSEATLAEFRKEKPDFQTETLYKAVLQVDDWIFNEL